MKPLAFLFCLLTLPLTAMAQFVPPSAPATRAVTVDGDNVLVAPTFEDLAAANPDLLSRSEQRYPMFVFEVPYGAPWTDFELKASRTDFGNSASPALDYYFHSPGAMAGEIGDPPHVWYNRTGGDTRRWRQLSHSPRQSIFSNLPDANSQVGTIIVIVTDPAVINSSQDTSLLWAMVWLDGTSREDDVGGRALWRAVVPVRWVPANFTP